MGQYPENSPRSPKCSCLTWSSPPQQTRRYLFRQQSKNQTTERFQCDFCKFSLQHSLWSQVAPRARRGASCSKPRAAEPPPPWSPPPALGCSRAFRQEWGNGGRALTAACTGMGTAPGRDLPSSESRTDRRQAALTSPQMLARLCSVDPEVIPVLEHGQK